MKQFTLACNVILRVITLPLIMALYIVARFRDLITISIMYLKYGGEFLTYTEKIKPQTFYAWMEKNLEK